MPAIDTTKEFTPLPESDAAYTGASGDGNDPSTTDLKRGFSKDSAINSTPFSMFDQVGGFLGRAKGWER